MSGVTYNPLSCAAYRGAGYLLDELLPALVKEVGSSECSADNGLACVVTAAEGIDVAAVTLTGAAAAAVGIAADVIGGGLALPFDIYPCALQFAKSHQPTDCLRSDLGDLQDQLPEVLTVE